MTTTANVPVLMFTLSPLMTSDDPFKETHDKTSDRTLVNKTTRQTIIMMVMSYECISSVPPSGRSL
jgi:hypothetical protein